MNILDKIIDTINNLLKIKSIWSLGALAMFIFLTVTDRISGETALAIITTIITYYFTKRKEDDIDETERIQAKIDYTREGQ